MQSALLVDGENFRRKLEAVFIRDNQAKPVWHTYDFKGLLETVLQEIKINRTIFYFARLKEHPETREKSKALIEGRRLLKAHLEKQGFEVVFSGRVQGHMERL
jgi:transposase